MFSIMDLRAVARMGMNGEAETAGAPLVTNGGFKTQHPHEDLPCTLHRPLRILLPLQTLTLRTSFQDQVG